MNSADPTTARTRRIVTLTGDLGSGKSTYAKILADRWNIPRHSAGSVFREIASAKSHSVMSANADSAIAQAIDQEVDDELRRLPQKHVGDFVVDSRLAWHFIPQSFKVKLTVIPEVGASRIFNDVSRQAKNEIYTDATEAFKKVVARRKNEWDRWREMYGTDVDNDANFDLIINTSFVDFDSVTKIIDDATNAFYEGQKYPKNWLSPKLLYPLETIMRKSEEYCDEMVDEIQANGFSIDYPVEAVDYQNNWFLAEGHHRSFAALVADVVLIPADVYREHDALPGGVNAGQNVRNLYKTGYVYDWQDAVNFCRKKHGQAPLNWADFQPKVPVGPL